MDGKMAGGRREKEGENGERRGKGGERERGRLRGIRREAHGERDRGRGIGRRKGKVGREDGKGERGDEDGEEERQGERDRGRGTRRGNKIYKCPSSEYRPQGRSSPETEGSASFGRSSAAVSERGTKGLRDGSGSRLSLGVISGLVYEGVPVPRWLGSGDPCVVAAPRRLQDLLAPEKIARRVNVTFRALRNSDLLLLAGLIM